MNSIIIPILAHPVMTIYIPTKKHIVPGNFDRFVSNDFKFLIPIVMNNPNDINI